MYFVEDHALLDEVGRDPQGIELVSPTEIKVTRIVFFTIGYHKYIIITSTPPFQMIINLINKPISVNPKTTIFQPSLYSRGLFPLHKTPIAANCDIKGGCV